MGHRLRGADQGRHPDPASQTDYVAQDYWNKNKNKLEKISPVSHDLFDGIAVPSYVPINSIDELEANADRFGGKIIGIEPGAGLKDGKTMDQAVADWVSAHGDLLKRWENIKKY